MKQILTLMVMTAIATKHAGSQPMPAELMIGHKFVLYQHNLAKPLKPGSRLGFMHITNLLIRYQPSPEKNGIPNEIMNQAYLRYRIKPSVALLAGVFYNKVTDYKLSAALQFSKRKESLLLVLMPRFDIGKTTSYELFGLIEYQPAITKRHNLYLRFQGMTNHGTHQHNRSYQQIRAGVSNKTLSFGWALNLDEYGPDMKMHINTGIFLRTEFQ